MPNEMNRWTCLLFYVKQREAHVGIVVKSKENASENKGKVLQKRRGTSVEPKEKDRTSKGI